MLGTVLKHSTWRCDASYWVIGEGQDHLNVRSIENGVHGMIDEPSFTITGHICCGAVGIYMVRPFWASSS